MRGTGTFLAAGLLVLLASLLLAGVAAGVPTTDTGTGTTTTDGFDGFEGMAEGGDRPWGNNRDTESDTDVDRGRNGSVSTARDPPLADAGLDQTVPRGTTVYLDGGASVGLNASLTAYNWRIEHPDGSITTPTCTTTTCVRASFVPGQFGTYNVTLTVTDDDGERATDTLYVFVEKREPPTAQVTGPDRLAMGEQGTFVLTATAGKAPLSSIRWTVDGARHDSSFVDGGMRWELNHTFSQPGAHTVGGTVTDVLGIEASDRHAVAVGPGSGPLFLVEITGTNSPIEAGETLTVDAVVTNAGNQSGTQGIALETFTGDTPDSTAVSLVPGENTTVAFEWNTTSEDAGDGPVTVRTENDTDSETVTVAPGNSTFFAVTDIDYDWPENKTGPISYAVTYENFGVDSGNQTVTVTQPGGVGTLGDHPLQLAAGEAVTRSYEWEPGGPDGWHDSAGEDVLVVARTADHDRGSYFPVPELPRFEVNFTEAHVIPEGAVTGFPDSPVTLVKLEDVEITNTGGVAGSRPVEFWVAQEYGPSGKVDQLEDSAELPNGITLDPGETYEVGDYPSRRGQLRWTSPDANSETATLEVKTPSDVDAIDVGWTYNPSPGPDPCSGGSEYLEVNHRDYALGAKKIDLSVARVYCNNGSVEREILNPSQYTVSHSAGGSTAGSAYFNTNDEWVKAWIPPGYPDVGMAFTVEYGSLTTASGARWFSDKNDIP